MPPPAVPKSPVPHLLSTNVPPTDEETALVRAAIKAASAQSAALEQTTPGHQRLGSSRSQRALLRFIEDHRRVLSPVRRLPADMIREIVGHCPGLHWLASHVCSSWRHTVLSTPSFWTALPSLSLSMNTRTPSYLAMLTHVLTHSRGAPLTVVIPAPLFKGTHHPLLNSIIAHSTRWKHLKLHIPFNLLPAFTAIKHQLPLLESLELDILEVPLFLAGSQNAQAPSLDIFSDCPRLTQFTNAGHHLNVHLPVHQLAHYTGTLSRTSTYLHFTQFSSALTSLTLHDSTYDPNLPPLQPITLTNLKHLEMNFFFWGRRQSVVIDFLVTPNLESLSIIDTTPSLVPRLAGMLERSERPSTLKSFSLFSHSLAPGMLEALLREMPGVEDIKMNIPPVQDIMAMVIPPPNPGKSQGYSQRIHAEKPAPPLVPKLVSIQIVSPRVAVSDMETIEALNALAKSRCEAQNVRTSLSAFSPVPAATSSASLSTPQVSRIHTFVITFPSFHGCHLQRCLLEAWDRELDAQPVEGDEDAAQGISTPQRSTTQTRRRAQLIQLENLKAALLDELPELKRWVLVVPGSHANGRGGADDGVVTGLPTSSAAGGGGGGFFSALGLGFGFGGRGSRRSPTLIDAFAGTGTGVGGTPSLVTPTATTPPSSPKKHRFSFSSLSSSSSSSLKDLVGLGDRKPRESKKYRRWRERVWRILEDIERVGFGEEDGDGGLDGVVIYSSTLYQHLKALNDLGAYHLDDPDPGAHATTDAQKPAHRKTGSVSSTLSSSSTSSSTSTSSSESSMTGFPSGPLNQSFPTQEPKLAQFAPAARRILRKWRPGMEKTLDGARWMVKGGGRSVVYLARDHEVRRGASIEELIFGFPVGS